MLALFGFFRVDYDDDLRNLLKSDREISERYSRFLGRFPALENQIFLLVEGDSVVDKAALEAVRNLHLDLQFVDGVVSVLSVFSARHPPDENNNMRSVFPEVLPDGEALEKLVEEARAHPLLADKMLSRDGSATLLVVGLAASLNDYPRYVKFFDEIDAVVKDVMADVPLRVTPTGEPSLRYEILSIIRSDMRVLNLSGGVIAILVCALFFRRLILIFLASFAPLIGVIWTLGGFGLLGVKITAMSNILPTLVLVIGFSDSLHMVFSMRRLLQQGKSPADAVRTSVREVGPACAMTSITTMIALGALGFSESAVIQQFGIGGAFAVFVAFIAVVGLVPTLAMLLLPFLKARPASARENLFTRLASAGSGHMWRFVERRTLMVTLCGAVLLVATGTAYFRLQPAYDYREYLSPYSEANAAIDRINDKMGGADISFVMIERVANSSKVHSSQVIAAVQTAVESQARVQQCQFAVQPAGLDEAAG